VLSVEEPRPGAAVVTALLDEAGERVVNGAPAGKVEARVTLRAEAAFVVGGDGAGAWQLVAVTTLPQIVV
jgi:hypothetical protein